MKRNEILLDACQAMAAQSDLNEEEWQTFANCCILDVPAVECAALLQRDPRQIRVLYTQVALCMAKEALGQYLQTESMSPVQRKRL